MKLNILCVVLLTLVIQYGCPSHLDDGQCLNVKTSLGSMRKRRHLTFPDASTIVLTISLVKAFMTHAPSGWNIALEIDVLYPLPEKEFTNRHFRKKQHHKQKRELWEKIRQALDFYNINGHSCVLRGVCEAKTRLAPPGKSLVHDLLRVIFRAPNQDEEFIEEMKGYYEVSDFVSCYDYNDCPFSILDYVLKLQK